jgi:hypothetical protein
MLTSFEIELLKYTNAHDVSKEWLQVVVELIGRRLNHRETVR